MGIIMVYRPTNTGWWLEPWNFMTFHSVRNVIIPTAQATFIFFRGVGIPPTRLEVVRTLGFRHFKTLGSKNPTSGRRVHQDAD
jgi:acyl-coenzyme A synthetase/AMP-(fatty) acid ligase